MILRLARSGLSGALAFALSVAACSAPAATPVAPSTAVGSAPSSRITLDYPESRVSVQVTVNGKSGRTLVLATFSPTEAGLHLYATEMADNGIDGAGRPTRLVVDDPGWRASGPVVAGETVEELRILGFDEAFPVYRDGPVTLRQEVIQLDPADRTIDVRIGFMACSARVCYLPVWNAPLTVGTD